MAKEEQYGTRDLSYSKWHRAQSTSRFLCEHDASNLSMIDADVCIYIEYADKIKKPLILIETAMDIGQDIKTASVTKALADMANIPAFVLLYKISQTERNPAYPDIYDIESFRFKCIGDVGYGNHKNYDWITMAPDEWAKYLLRVRNWSANNLGVFIV